MRCLMGLLIALVLSVPAYADTDLLYRELLLTGGLYNGHPDVMRSHPQTAVGLDWLHKFSGDRGDWGTAGAQLRFVLLAEHDRLDTDVMTLWYQHRGDQGRLNWRVGKFEIPYGLEPVLDTHQTLLQSNGHHNLGDLWSWGAQVNGQLDRVDYALALTTGDFSENLPHRSQDSWLLSGRVGSPRSGRDTAWGISGALGRTVPGQHSEHVADMPVDPHGGGHALDRDAALDILRLGVDYTYWAGQETWLAEGSLGTDDGDLMGSLWLRWEYVPLTDDRWQIALQAEGAWHPPDLADDFTELSTQVSYRLNSTSTVRLLAGRAFETLTGDREDRLLLQYAYFGL